ncbi:hypothetical protein D3C75_1060580 [compost metagenome]
MLTIRRLSTRTSLPSAVTAVKLRDNVPSFMLSSRRNSLTVQAARSSGVPSISMLIPIQFVLFSTLAKYSG